MSISIGKVATWEGKHINHSGDTRTLSSGEVVKIFDYVLTWDDDCVGEDLSRNWRNLGDPLCDDALETVFLTSSSSVGKDLLATLERFTAENPEDEPVHRFLEEVRQVPPPAVRVNERDVRLAQQLFLDNSIEIVQALLHYSLAGGFASPRIVRTLQAVSYLVPHSSKHANDQAKELDNSLSSLQRSSRITSASNERTFSRLLETFQFVLDVLACSASPPVDDQGAIDPSENTANSQCVQDGTAAAYLLPGGLGWRSTVNVRLLHGIARMRVKERWRKQSIYDDRVPINQEELGGTLAAFSTIPMWCLRRLHVPPSDAHANAYLALWRHVGFYLGVSPSILLRYFSNSATADKFVATTALHLFSDDGSDAADAPTIPILRAASDRPPTYTSFEYNCALTWYLLGPSLAARLGLGAPSLRMRIRMHALLLLQRVPHWFARWYPRKGWILKRRAALKEGIARSVRWSLGMRRASFRPRTAIAIAGASNVTDAGEGGDLAPGVKEAESVKPDPAGAAALVKQWREVLVEMATVCAGVGLLGIGLLYTTIQWSWAYL
ncbi:uncharacterized protein LAESUDRAFT_730745 [Laetiporus sulphureus 93-53]|uniref:ER-bound oxygenase mpaB/mpaB'/Rubber oxygenase catalytic domain-containing protein n=1 Tax=Laetiporus sulphureus 93-53 TaxID=1314785 RepID=A0A165BXY4_9APHY|nr:uncharacterized protein LAESUDRAFT_730745 [Laetiporus sulphureus 93-53]KZT01853.1 hypothetical protein LAESUDRAFT_730745 [Laetiporus sulphureus 93-53]